MATCLISWRNTEYNMKIDQITTARLDEKLGNLAQLGVGNLINIVKQKSHLSGIGNKFQNSSGNWGIGNSSEIIDGGVIKSGIKDVRDAMRKFNTANQDRGKRIYAIALYIGGHPVGFGEYERDTLAGSTRTGRFAYDLSKFSDAIDQYHAEQNKSKNSWQRTSKPDATSAYTKIHHTYPNGYSKPAVEIPINNIGKTDFSTGALAASLEWFLAIANIVNQPLTFKMVTNDLAGADRRSTRHKLARSEVLQGAAALATRLANYKNSKRPTAENIQEFMTMVANKVANVVNFGGRPWKTTPKSNDKVSPIDLLKGGGFKLDYSSAEPDSYQSLYLYYYYDVTTATIKPWKAEWSGNDYKTQVAVLDKPYWIKSALGVKSLEKPEVIRAMLMAIKDSPGEHTYKKVNQAINILRDMGNDWPEFAIINKSIDTAKETPNT
jgi:hypothetical protein